MTAIERLLRDDVAGDPITGMRWTRRTTDKIADELATIGIVVSGKTVGRLLKEMKFSLKTNRKNIISGGKKKPGYRKSRDQQFQYLKKIRGTHQKMGVPIIGVDTKKKEEIGNFKNNGRTWTKKAKEVHDHDFKTNSIGKAVPYGIYDVTKNLGHVVLGQSKDTPAFATDAIEQWWRMDGCKKYPQASEILILADCGGSNGAKSRVWKRDLQLKLCNKHNLKITVCHLPPGASKWNPIEHRLFSQISRNWAGVPLKSYETAINYIKTTTTKTGLKVKATRNRKIYETGQKVSSEEFASIRCRHRSVLPEWNYSIIPNSKLHSGKM